jgi:hypothetical protein
MYTQKTNTSHFFTEAMYTDAPYGYDLFPHDQQITVHTLLSQSKQFDAINTKECSVWIVIHKMDDTNIVKEAMTTRGYTNLQHVFWAKPNHYVAGPVHKLTPVVETITVGCIPNAASITWNVSDDPRKRPNLFSWPSVASLAKDSAGNVINCTEKPPELAAFLLGMFCKKGANVLMVGTGAGGCVKGALTAGFNVIGVENDEKQYNQLFSEMNAWVSIAKKETEQVKPKSRKIKTTVDKGAASSSLVTEAAAEPSNLVTVVAAVQAGQCFSCEEPAKDGNPLGKCGQCGVQNHVKECMTDVAGDPGVDQVLVCSGCLAKLF